MLDVEPFKQAMCEIAAALLAERHTIFEGTTSAIQLAWLHDLVRARGAVRVVEIGFNAGFSSHAFLAAGPRVEVVSFDLGAHPYVGAAKRFIDARFPGRHTLVRGDSRQTVPAFAAAKPQRFNLVFIDGGHDYDVARSDLESMAALAAPGAALVMDDLMPWIYFGEGPTRAWDEAVASGRVRESGRYQDGQPVNRAAPPADRVWALGSYV